MGAFGISIVFLGAVLICIASEGSAAGLTGTILVFLGGMLLFHGMDEEDKPSAMDVYQGKTTLEITYRDGVPVDSVVVFKK